jgi:MFS family permease
MSANGQRRFAQQRDMTSETTRRIFSRKFILGCSTQFIFLFVFHILVPTLPIYLSRLGSTEAEIGILIGVFFVSSLIFRPLVGKALLRVPEKTFMLAGALLFALTCLAYLWALPFWHFFIVRFFQGIGLAFFHTATYTLIANISPKEHRAQSLSYFLLASNFSMAVGPPAGMFISNHFGFTVLFLVCSGISLSCLYLSTKVSGAGKTAASETSSSSKDSLLSLEALPPSILTFFNQVIFGALIAFFPLYAINRGVADPGLFFTAVAITLIGARAFGGKILDLYSKEKLIPLFTTTYIVSMAILAFSGTLPMFVLVAVIFGIGNAFYSPVVLAYALDRAKTSPGPVVGTYTALADLGLGLGPVIMGFVVRFSSYQIMFLSLSLTAIISLTYFHFFVRKR